MHRRCTPLAFALVLLAACADGNDEEGDSQSTDTETTAEGPDDNDGPSDEGPADDDGPGDEGPDDDGPGDDTSGDDDTSDDDEGQNAACADGPLPTPIAGCAPPAPPASDDPHQDCVDRINQLRWECQCLPPLARWTDAEACTDDQSGADQSVNGAHANFGSCNEFGQNTCPNWGSDEEVIGGCFQSMWDEGPGEPFSEHGHYINMTNPDYTKVACGFSSGASGVWSNQNFSG